jgi:hypothetical protein
MNSTATPAPAAVSPAARSARSPDQPTDGKVRLNLGGSATPNRFDGTWQPRTRNLAEELPGLIAALIEHGIPVARVSYHRGSWEAVPRRLIIDGRVIRLGGFRHIEPHQLSTVDLYHNHRTDLEILPPDAPGRAEERRATTPEARQPQPSGR